LSSLSDAAVATQDDTGPITRTLWAYNLHVGMQIYSLADLQRSSARDTETLSEKESRSLVGVGGKIISPVVIHQSPRRGEQLSEDKDIEMVVQQ